MRQLGSRRKRSQQISDGSDHRIVRVKIVLDINFVRLKLTRKSLTPKINSGSMKENRADPRNM